jgi:hypothetical protein
MLIHTNVGIVVFWLCDYLNADKSEVPFEKLIVHNGIPAGNIRGKISIATSSRKLSERQGSMQVPGCTCATM